MPSADDLKPRFQRLLRPPARFLAASGVTPNQVALATLALSAFWGLLIACRPTDLWPLLLLPAVLFVRMALSAIGGMIARECDMKPGLGGMLNEPGDFLSEAALYLPLGCVPGISGLLIGAIVALAAAGELAGMLTQAAGASRRTDGLMGRGARAFVFGALGLALGLGLRPGLWSTAVLLAVIAALAVTIITRARRGLNEAESEKCGIPNASEGSAQKKCSNPNAGEGSAASPTKIPKKSLLRLRARRRAIRRM